MSKIVLFMIILVSILSCNDKFDFSSPYTIDKKYVKDQESCFEDSDCDKIKKDYLNCDLSDEEGKRCICDKNLRICQYKSHNANRNCPENFVFSDREGECICIDGYIYDEKDDICYKNESLHNFEFSLGKNHTCAIKSGSLYCWGSNDTGKLGIKNDSNEYFERTPKKISEYTDWLLIANSTDFSCALRGRELGDASVFCWGMGKREPVELSSKQKWKYITANHLGIYLLDSAGVLYIIENETVKYSRRIELFGDNTLSFKSFSAGAYHYCAITDDNKLYCWGEDYSGEVGNGDTDNNPDIVIESPVKIGDDNWKMVSCGNSYTCGIKEDGYVYCWGNNTIGKLGFDECENNKIYTPHKVNGNKYLYVYSAYDYTCGISEDNNEGSGLYRNVFCWGNNQNHQFGEIDDFDHSYDQYCKYGIKSGAGDRENDICSIPIKIKISTTIEADLKEIKLGLYENIPYKCILDSNSKLSCSGFNNSGQVGTSNLCSDGFCDSFQDVHFFE